MQQYNDFYHLTEGYLRNYTEFTIALENMKTARLQKKAELESTKLPTAKYGVEPGGAKELTQPEAYSDRLIMLERGIHSLGVDIVGLQLLLDRVDCAMGSLAEVEGKLVKLRYYGRRQWQAVAEETGYSERQCKRLTRKAVWRVCESLFGHKMFIEKRFWFVD